MSESISKKLDAGKTQTRSQGWGGRDGRIPQTHRIQESVCKMLGRHLWAQKVSSDPPELELELQVTKPPYGFRKLNTGPLQEQQVVLAAEPSLLATSAGDLNLGLHGCTQRLLVYQKLTQGGGQVMRAASLESPPRHPLITCILQNPTPCRGQEGVAAGVPGGGC